MTARPQGKRRKAKGERQKEKGKRRKAKGERQKEKGKRRKAKGKSLKRLDPGHIDRRLR